MLLGVFNVDVMVQMEKAFKELHLLCFPGFGFIVLMS